MSMPCLETRKLSKTLKSGGRPLTILDDINVAIAPGEFVAILGPSGSGKSTLLALLAGLDRPSAGEVLFEGKPIHDLSEDQLSILRRDNIGFVFQSFQLLPHLTAWENIVFPLELVDAPERAARVEELLDAVGLSERGHHYPTQLSGGEQQRIALARAFATKPSLLLADEPTGNLDSKTGDGVLELLTDLQRIEGTTLVLVTHDPVIASHADRLIYLRDGRIDRVEDNTTDGVVR